MSNKNCPPCHGNCIQGRHCPATWTPVVDEEDNEPFVLVVHPDDPLLAHIPGGMKVITQRHLPRHKIVPLQGLTFPELTQRPMPWTGLTIAAAIVCFCAWVALLVHAAGVHGWLR